MLKSGGGQKVFIFTGGGGGGGGGTGGGGGQKCLVLGGGGGGGGGGAGSYCMSGRSENFHFQGGLPYKGGVNFLGVGSYPSAYYGWII